MPKKILVIDDEEILTRTFTLLLEKSGYQVYTAKNGADAEVLAEEEPFDLIICDIRMPGVNGVQIIKAVRSLRRDHPNKAIPVIFITGFADEAIEKEARQLGPLAYLYKPFDNTVILKTIREKIGA